MVGAFELVQQLKSRGISLSRIGNRLRFHPQSKMTPELLQALKQHKHTIAELLETNGDAPDRERIITTRDLPCFTSNGNLGVIPTGTRGRLITDLEAEFPAPAERELWQSQVLAHIGEPGWDLLLVEIGGQVRAVARGAIRRVPNP